MTITKDFQLRRVIAVLGEGAAPAAFLVQGRLAILEDGAELSSSNVERPATREEVDQLFGSGHAAQLVNIDMLTARMAEQKAELEAVARDLRTNHAIAIDNAAKAIAERDLALMNATRRAEIAETKLANLADLGRQYDHAAASLLPAP